MREWLRFALVTLFLFLAIRGVALEAFTIPTSSMEQTLLVGDFLLVNKAVYGAEVPLTRGRLPALRDPRRGEVIVFRPPHDVGRSYVKRLVGTPGDTLEMRGKAFFVNGELQQEAYVTFRDRRGDAVHPDMGWQSDYLAAAPRHRAYSPSRDNWGPLVVPEGEYFVLGDNRDNSEDSRYWGFVARENVIGSPWLVYLSLESEEGAGSQWWSRVRWARVGRKIR